MVDTTSVSKASDPSKKNHLHLRQALWIGLFIAGIVGFVQLTRSPTINASIVAWNTYLIEWLKAYGLWGAFLNSLISNASLGIQIPYPPIFIYLASQNDSITYLLILTLLGGLGCTLGEVISFIWGKWGGALILSKRSREFKTVQHVMTHRPRLISWMIFFVAVTPFPDDFFVVPLALIQYDVKRIIMPTLIGKTIFLAILVFVTHYTAISLPATDLGGLSTSFVVLLVIVFIMIILHQFLPNNDEPDQVPKWQQVAMDKWEAFIYRLCPPVESPDEM